MPCRQICAMLLLWVGQALRDDFKRCRVTALWEIRVAGDRSTHASIRRCL